MKTINILFVCHGNTCRSPMAEYVLKDMLKKRGALNRFHVESAATSEEDLGCFMNPNTIRKLAEAGITYDHRTAVQVEKADYEKYDYILVMDSRNMRNLMNIFGKDPENKIHKLLDYSLNPRDISDPWYSGNFDLAYNDIKEGCEAFLEHII